MNSLKDLRNSVKDLDIKVVFKTNGDFCPVTRKKVYAMYHNGEKISPRYTVKEWNIFKVNQYLLKIESK